MRIILGILMCLVGATSVFASDESELFGKLLVLANAGDAEAQYHVGMMLNNGIGIDQDPNQAFDWFVKSSAGGDPLGAYKVGCYYAGQFGAVATDLEKALEFKLIAAKAGYALAQSDVAVAYASQGNWEEALGWWNKSAHQGYVGALQALASLYLKGEYVPQDRALGYAYFELLFQAGQIAEDNPARAGLERISAELSKTELEAAKEIISEWQTRPTPLTLRAGEGIGAAFKEVEGVQ